MFRPRQEPLIRRTACQQRPRSRSHRHRTRAASLRGLLGPGRYPM